MVAKIEGGRVLVMNTDKIKYITCSRDDESTEEEQRGNDTYEQVKLFKKQKYQISWAIKDL